MQPDSYVSIIEMAQYRAYTQLIDCAHKMKNQIFISNYVSNGWMHF